MQLQASRPDEQIENKPGWVVLHSPGQFRLLAMVPSGRNLWRMLRKQRRPRLIVAGSGTTQPRAVGKRPGRAVGVVGFGNRGFKSAEILSKDIVHAGASLMFTGHSGKGSTRGPEATLKENRIYFDDVFRRTSIMREELAWEGFKILTDMNGDFCKCTLIAQGLNIPEKPGSRAHDMNEGI
jgi:hypothetical protein